MNASLYQVLAARTLIDKPDFEISIEHIHLIIDLIRMAAAVGKSFEILKKGVLHQHGFDDYAFNYHMDTVLWYADDLRNRRTDISLPDTLTDQQIMIAWNIIGLIGECGEVSDLFADSVLNELQIDGKQAKKEVGDISWYLAGLCTKLGLDLGDVMETNIEKLKTRYPNGYKSVDSMARVDTQPYSRSAE